MQNFQKHIAQVGVILSDGPTQSSSGSVFAFVDAPDGYEVEIIERPKP
jgi:lactoylglutathione lyase